jgi:hypothetical protein
MDRMNGMDLRDVTWNLNLRYSVVKKVMSSFRPIPGCDYMR